MSSLTSNGHQQLLSSIVPDFSDLTPVEVGPFAIGPDRYVLKEASAGAVRKYKSASLQGTEMSFNDDSSTRTMRNFGNITSAESMLVALCLFKVDGDTRRSVSQATIEEWPIRVQTKLFETLEEISPGLNATETLPLLLKQRDKLDQKIKRLEEADPKKLLAVGMESSD